ncbi:YLR143W [Saccharomyces arboricola H-6]|uniref:Diphthine--ammonia ligase n=1 Tax=Saccharomyces arboricola (strain H-6 / AS 2.3317 / CBS 10644) TaxID=1160507 RepID=J8Q227_SACAR|nr:YLR143W [Saccharomyces arboricola H-6]
MKFLALISGGKDSFYNIFHCLKNNHELIALGNLYPKESEKQELDSFMFQTVGHDLIDYYPKCIGVPLFRRSILRDTSKNVELNYTATQDDEIEELYELLKSVKDQIPDLEAISVGAILSSYQRTRVENVCSRLGLVVLSYLWQRDQAELMEEMCLMSKNISDIESNTNLENKFDARIIKVAAIGLNDNHLGKSLPMIQPVLHKLNQLYQVHICGEGGEFETMVLDAPFFRHGYLKLTDMVKSSDGEVHNARLRVEFQPRTLNEGFLQTQLDKLPVPSVLHDNWQELLQVLTNRQMETRKIEVGNIISKNVTTTSINKLNGKMYVSNLQSHGSKTVEEQSQDIFAELTEILRFNEIPRNHILSSSLLVKNMSDFGKINKIYNEFLDLAKYGPLPPSRACVGSRRLPEGCHMQLSVVIDIRNTHSDKISGNKGGLHVQGRSYWAPCNIGPYSQSIWLSDDANQVSFISGQIGLIPQSMVILEKDPLCQTILALQHFDTLCRTIGAQKKLFMTCYISDKSIIDIACKAWALYCSDLSCDDKECLIIVKISQLPRGAVAEWGGVACGQLQIDENDYDREDGEDEDISCKFEELSLNIDFLHTITVGSFESQKQFITGFTGDKEELSLVLEKCSKLAQVTLYFNSEESIPFHHNVEYYPVEKVFDHHGKEHRFGLHIRS